MEIVYGGEVKSFRPVGQTVKYLLKLQSTAIWSTNFHKWMFIQQVLWIWNQQLLNTFWNEKNWVSGGISF